MKQFHQYLVTIYNLHRKKSFQEFSGHGLTSGQPKMLEKLQQLNGYTQKDLAAALELEPPTITSLIRNMEKKELIYREPEKRDNGTHVMRVFLTKKGETTGNIVNTVVNEMEELSFEGFSEKEKEECLNYLERIYSNLKKQS